MIQILKYKTPETIGNYEKILVEAWKKGWRFSHEWMDHMWFDRIEPKKQVSKNLEDSMFYEENKTLWKEWSDKLKEAYKTFRQERFAQHKDFVSHGAEKLLMNKINKYNESISIKLMKASASYKSIVEHKEIIELWRSQVQREEYIKEEERKHKEKQEALDKRQKQDQAIKNSGETSKYWEWIAMKELKEQYPNYSEVMLNTQINPRVRIILEREWFLK